MKAPIALLFAGVLASSATAQVPDLPDPVVYPHRDTAGMASLRADAAELARRGNPLRVTVRAVFRFVPDKDAWETVRLAGQPSITLAVPAPQQIHSPETDPVIFEAPGPVGLFWVVWDEDGRLEANPLVAGPVLCIDSRPGPAPADRVAACVPFAVHAEVRFIPDPEDL
ncbi:MAG: hypothetical protein AB7I33_16415, partial [Gemmatimonadales bacterium]